ncbi:hypothetical protein FB567DRAFT_516412 [Paraphoma chrysanthemicola]|uniref:DUF7730 domain-containing protein n=1 Tax=Paraphoma chrysanthemicola TaxID=798071 RepID=A0A8K0W2D7_9PLEO|nr:hypothetical protein FB567DRAFT_516412 [Paraphoma chrysanthemicola]
MLHEIPYDVRRKIYDYIMPSSVHIWTTGGVTRLFSCVPPPAIDPKEPGRECQEGLPLEADKWDESHTETWAVRLRSSWGPHWKCEEKAKELVDNLDTIEVLLQVNKQINADIVDLIVTSAEVIIADIASFETFVRRSVDFKFSCRFEDVQKLRIVAKLHTRALETIERRNQTPTKDSTGEIAERNDPEVVAWQRLSSTLAHVTALRTLRVWLDRSEEHYWTTVDESAILAPLRPLADRGQLDVCIELPRHYNDDITTFPFKVTRRLRQRFFGHIESQCKPRTFQKDDFPMLLDDDEFSVYGLSAAELEKAERALWRDGVDIERDIIFYGCFVYRGTV